MTKTEIENEQDSLPSSKNVENQSSDTRQNESAKKNIDSELKKSSINYEILKQSMKSIAGVCDYANTQDGQGFNGRDTEFGHILAEKDNWSPKMAKIAYKYAKLYRKQLLGFGINFDDIRDPSTYEPKKQLKKEEIGELINKYKDRDQINRIGDKKNEKEENPPEEEDLEKYKQTDFLIRECLKTNELRDKGDFHLLLNSIEIEDFKDLDLISHVRDICEENGIESKRFNAFYNELFPNTDLTEVIRKGNMFITQTIKGTLICEPKSTLRKQKIPDGNGGSTTIFVETYYFTIRDSNDNVVKCCSDNMPYKNLKHNDIVVLIGQIAFMGDKPIFDVDKMNKIGEENYVYAKEDKSKLGTQYFDNTENGVIIYWVNKNSQKINAKAIYTRKQLVLNGIFVGLSKTIYDINIGENNYCDEISKLQMLIAKDVNVIQPNRDKIQRMLKSLLLKLKEKNNIKVKEIFNWCGIHRDKNDNAIVEMGLENRVIGEHGYQIEWNERILKVKWDMEGKHIKNYYDLLKYKKIDEIPKLLSFGYIPLSLFGNLYKDSEIKLFYDLYLVGKPATGKTTFLSLLIEELFGVETVQGDNIGSPSRIMDYLSSSTIPLLVEEINKLSDSCVNYLKGVGTGRIVGSRKNKDQSINLYPTNCVIAGTANDIEWLDKDDAKKNGRSLVVDWNIKAKINDLIDFQKICNKIINSPRLGVYFMNQWLDYIRNSDKTDISDKEKLVNLITNKQKELVPLIMEKGIELTDNRRVTIYAMELIGLEMWDSVFKSNGLTDSTIISDFINLKNNDFWEMLKKMEGANIEARNKKLRNLLQFIEENWENDPIKYDSETDKSKYGFYEYGEKLFIDGNFQTKYNQWASRQRLDTFENLQKIAKLIDKSISGREIKAKPNRIGRGKKDNKWSIEFPIREIFPNWNIESPLDEPTDLDEFSDNSKILKNSEKSIFIQTMKKIESMKNGVSFEQIFEIFEVFDEEFVKKTLQKGIRQNKFRLINERYWKFCEIDQENLIFRRIVELVKEDSKAGIEMEDLTEDLFNKNINKKEIKEYVENLRLHGLIEIKSDGFHYLGKIPI